MLRNIAKCKKCGTVIESKSVHDFQSCKCGAIFVDGGDEYIHRGGDAFDEEFDKQNGLVIKGAVLKEDSFEIKSPSEMTYEELQGFHTIFGQTILPMDVLVEKVWKWFDDKKLSDPVMQMVKVQEEVGELAHEISRGHKDSVEVVDALGDTLVTVIGMCHHLHITPASALTLAYNEIKDRKGKVVEGSFVKEENED